MPHFGEQKNPPDDANLTLAQRAFAPHPVAPGATAVATVVVDDASLTLAQKVYQQHAATGGVGPAGPAGATGPAGPTIVDDSSLQIATKAFAHPVYTPTLAVDDASLTLSQRAYQFHQSAPAAATAVASTDVLQTQVFGA